MNSFHILAAILGAAGGTGEGVRARVLAALTPVIPLHLSLSHLKALLRQLLFLLLAHVHVRLCKCMSQAHKESILRATYRCAFLKGYRLE